MLFWYQIYLRYKFIVTKQELYPIAGKFKFINHFQLKMIVHEELLKYEPDVKVAAEVKLGLKKYSLMSADSFTENK